MNVILARGSGYADDTTQDDFTIVAEPLADREARILGRDGDRPGSGTCYRAYSLRLAYRTSETGYKGTRQYFLLVRHGGGSETFALPMLFDRDGTIQAMLAMPEPALFGMLMMLYNTASRAAQQTRDETDAKWRRAHIDKRIRQRSYRASGTAKVWIEPTRREGESDESYAINKMLAAPSKR
jgi:hypothetical protein